MSDHKPILITGGKLLLALNVFSFWYKAISGRFHGIYSDEDPYKLTLERIDALAKRLGGETGTLHASQCDGSWDQLQFMRRMLLANPEAQAVNFNAEPILSLLEEAIHCSSTPSFRRFLQMLAVDEVGLSDIDPEGRHPYLMAK